ncbi:MAG: hypothetical protein AAGA93_06265 [Actinomycetota bacterium]
MDDRIDDIRSRLESIAEELTDVSVDLLREAVEAGETARPEMDKRLAQARRAVEKASRALEA